MLLFVEMGRNHATDELRYTIDASKRKPTERSDTIPGVGYRRVDSVSSVYFIS